MSSSKTLTVGCTTAIAQQNIIRVGLSMTEYYKWSYNYQGFTASVTPTTGTASSFSITVSTWGAGSSRICFFLVVIKAQATTKYIDLINFSINILIPGFPSNTAVDNNNGGPRSVTTSIDITTSTIFTSTTGLNLYPFTTSLKMIAVWKNDWDKWDSGKMLDFNVVVVITGNNAVITLKAQTETRIAGFQGMILIVNPSVITINATQNMTSTINTFALGANYNLTSVRSTFGPNFNSKCILGFNRQKYKGSDWMHTYLTNSVLGNFENIRHDSGGTPPTSDWRFFCFGNDSQCGEAQKHIDSLNGLCYTPSTCPLPVFTLWTKINLCPICTQQICLNCTVTNRSNCLTCGPFSTLVSGVCVCDASYVGVYTSISTSTQGMWNNMASSLTTCKIQCSSLSGCAANSCTNITYCTLCISGYAMVIVSVTEQYCDDCPSMITNCITCSTPTVCTTCAVGFYLTATFTCQACSVPMVECLTCSSGLVCSTCNTGYTINTSSLCQCNPALNSLADCATCQTPNICTSCVSNLYYVEPMDYLCYLCNNFDKQCLQCTEFQKCILCNAGYIPQVDTSGAMLCVLCSVPIPFCDQCSSLTVCTLCVSTNYYLTATTTCDLCGTPMPQCVTCSDSATCLTCTTGYTINTTTNLCQCDPVANSLTNCLTCSSPTVCTACILNLYFLSSTDFLCHICQDFDPQCLQCSANQTCTLCDTGYVLQTDTSGSILCVACSTVIPSCSQCSSLATCTLCMSTYYLTSTATCDLCSTPMPQCVTCTDYATCLTCSIGFVVNSSNLCSCDPVGNNLTYCQTCTSLTVCTLCVSNLYFLSPTNFSCYLCQNFDPQCTQCSAYQVCTLCNTGYIPKPNPDGTVLCVPCSTVITNCNQCSSLTACTLCASTNYYLTPGATCDLCGVPMPECVTCSDSLTCLTCNIGWTLNSSNLCYCDPIINNLTNCQKCAGLTICTACVSNLFYVNPFDFSCHVCQDFDPQCVQCSAYRVCTLCNAGFIPKPNTDGSALCVPCSTVIPNCTECSSLTSCTNCDPFYGLTLLTSCQKCDILLTVPYCSTCEDLSGCFGCFSPTVLAGGICYFCSYINMCETCFANAMDELECLSCQQGFYLTVDSLTGKPACKPCMNLLNYCKTCSSTQCFSCTRPYLIGPDNTCSLCIPGYELNSGFCSNIPGCRTMAQLPNGTQICISCIQQLNFVFDNALQKCVCAQGFKQYNVVNKLPNCVPNCGDGMVLSVFQQCDDKNVIFGDGCDSSCKVEPGFVCTIEQPSKCTLHLDFDMITFNYVSRILGQNAGILSFTINPSHTGLEKMVWSKLVKFNFSSTSVDSSQLRFSYSSATGELRVIVPYNEELETSDLESIITLDPNYVVSMTPIFVLQSKLNGINAPLTFEPESMLTTHQSINTISMIMTSLLLLQFYVGSYVHKMIGLETIQVIQSIYFARMVTGSSSTSALSSLNVIQYSATGYQNAQLIYGELEEVQNQSTIITPPEFTLIDMKHFFLLNVNLSLIPMLLVIVAYIVMLIRKYRARNQYIESKEQDEKDRYTQFRRSCQWVYDHGVFPFIMMFNLISFLEAIMLLSSKPQSITSTYKDMEDESFLIHMFMLFTTTAILCYEIFCSYEDYSKYIMTPRQRQRVPKSITQKLQHDENYPDRANYHPGYVLFYLVYYFLLSLLMVISTMIPSFEYCLQMTLGCGVLYFMVIAIWKPYHSSINIHNHFLKVYYGTFVLFMVICYMFAKVPQLSMDIYVGLIYVVTGLISVIMVCGFVRIFIEKNFRKLLEGNSSLLEWVNQIDQMNQNKKKLNIDIDQIEKDNFSSIKGINIPTKPSKIISKRESLVMRNQYAMKNQLTDMIKKNEEKLHSQQKKVLGFPGMNDDGLTSQEKEKKLIEEMKKEFEKKREDIIFEQKKVKKIKTPSGRSKIQQNLKEEALSSVDEKISKLKCIQNNLSGNQALELKQSLLQQIKSKMRRQWIMIDEE